MSVTGLPIRCSCSAGPILAIVRPSDDGGRFIHIKIYKQRRIYGEIIVEYGLVRVRCRECTRWFLLDVKAASVNAKQQDLPAALTF